MFSWFRKKRKSATPAPTTSIPAGHPLQDNDDPYPRLGTKVEITFSNAQRTWVESADLITLCARVLTENGHEIAPHDDGLLHKPSGIVLQPSLCDFKPHHPSGVSTTTLIDVKHPRPHRPFPPEPASSNTNDSK